MTPPLEDLLYTLDLCADSLPFDLQAEHIRRLEIIRQILTEKRESRPPARILSFCRTEPKREPGNKE
jgi:hypothetical protein